MKTSYSMLLFAMPLLAFSSPFPEIIVGGCGGCSRANADQPATPIKMFADQPTTLVSHSHIGEADEVGEQVHVKGRVLDLSGTPRSGVVVYAFQTIGESSKLLASDSAPEPRTRQGWAISNAQGNYSFHAMKPSDVASRDHLHIHFSIREVGRCVYYIDDLVLADDADLNGLHQRQDPKARGGSGNVVPTKDRKGVWQVTRDIRLGLNIPNYEKCLAR